MSDLDDIDDFYEESFENDKKVRPPAAPQKQNAPTNQNHNQQKNVQQNDSYDDDFNTKPLDQSYEDTNQQQSNKYDEYEDQEKNQKIPIIPKQSQQKPQAESHQIVRQASKHSEPNSQQPSAKKQENVIATSNSIQNSVMTNQNKQTLIEKNKKLKQDLKMLATELDKILVKEKEKREQRYSQKEEDEELKDRKSRVSKQVAEINKLKQNIIRIKNQLQNVYDNNNIVQKEDELLFLKKQIAEVKAEHDGLANINEKQQTALNELKDNGQYSSNVDKLRQTLMKVKDDYRKLNDQVQEQEKELRKQHESLITKEDNMRQLTERINEKKKSQNSHQSQVGDDDVYDKDIKDLEEKIKEQEARKKQIERKQLEKQKLIEKDKRDLQQELSKKLTILKSKEKEMKLNQIKLKEVEKYIRNLNSKEDVKSVVSESHIDVLNRDNSKNTKQLKRPPMLHKKPLQNQKKGENQQIIVEDQQGNSRSGLEDQDLKDRGRKKERTPERDNNNSNKKQRDFSPEQHQLNDKNIKKEKKEDFKKPAEEEVDLDELNYENQFDDYESRQNTGQGQRQSETNIPQNKNPSYQNISKHDEQREQQYPSKNNNKEFDIDDESEYNKNIDKDNTNEEKGEENVFSKPTFMLKKKK